MRCFYVAGVFVLFMLSHCTPELSVDLIPARVEKCSTNMVRDSICLQNGFEIVRIIVDKDCIVGSALSSFQINDINDETVSTDSWKGKIKVINFWFAECRPCIKEIPLVNDLKDQLSDKNILFKSINFKNSPSRILNFLENHEFNYQHYYSSDPDMEDEFALLWGYPMTLVLDEENVVRGIFENISGPEIRDSILELIHSIDAW